MLVAPLLVLNVLLKIPVLLSIWNLKKYESYWTQQICLHFVSVDPFPGFWEGTDKTVSGGRMALLAGQECG